MPAVCFEYDGTSDKTYAILYQDYATRAATNPLKYRIMAALLFVGLPGGTFKEPVTRPMQFYARLCSENGYEYTDRSRWQCFKCGFRGRICDDWAQDRQAGSKDEPVLLSLGPPLGLLVTVSSLRSYLSILSPVRTRRAV